MMLRQFVFAVCLMTLCVISLHGRAYSDSSLPQRKPVRLAQNLASMQPEKTDITWSAPTYKILTLDMVLESSAAHFPQIKAVLSDIEAARGAVQNAQGAFDLTAKNTTYSRYSGFYSGDFTDTELTKQFGDYNARVTLGYRIADGDFPIYQDYYFTNEDGEASLRVAFSLLRDREINKNTLRVMQNEIALDQTVLEGVITRMSVQRKALQSYLKWLTAGQRYKIYKQLLDIAQQRQDGLKTRAESGDAPRIQLVENSQLIVQRRTILRNARRNFENAANDLSLYWRSPDGLPLVPPAGMLPDSFPVLQQKTFEDINAEVDRILNIAPEVRQLDNDMKLAQADILDGENSNRPKLDLEFYNAQDFGFGQFGSTTREDFESTVQLKFSYNLQQNIGDGKIRSGRSKIQKLEFKRQQMTEKIRIALLNFVNNIKTASDIVALTEEEIDLTQQMEDAERIRFKNGQSDFFLINVREVNSANARIKRIDARRKYLDSVGDYLVATLDMNALKIDASGALSP